MGDNTLITKAGGDTVEENDVNQYKVAMTGSITPRASDGVVTNGAGSLGSILYRWLIGWFTTLRIGDPTNDNTIDEDGTDLRLASGSGIQMDINGAPLGTGIDENGINRDMLRKYEGAQLSSSSGTFATSSSTFVDVTNMSVSLTTKGGPVIVVAVPVSINAGFLAATAVGQWQFLRDAVLVGAGVVGIVYTGVSVMAYDTPAAGTYTYKMQAQRTGGGTTSIFHYKLLAYEL